jgi:hypothetical protein
MTEKANKKSRTSSTTRAHLTSASFSALGVHAKTLRAVSEVLRYEMMTVPCRRPRVDMPTAAARAIRGNTQQVVQQQTIPTALEGVDVIAKARTGTGKQVEPLCTDGPCSGAPASLRAGVLVALLATARTLCRP